MIQEPVNPLLVDLLKLSNKVRDKQRYLEIRQRDPNPNYEAGSTPAEAVKAVGDELDLLIARFIVEYTHHTASNYSLNSRLWGAVRREFVRRTSRLSFDQKLTEQVI